MYFTQLRNNAARLLVLVACFTELTLALPHRDSPRQRLLDGKELPSNLRPKKTDPYTPNFRDPYDHAVDPIADDLDPLPWRNGLGASVLGPWNKERSRQSPDLVRPPSTDHGNLPSLRWSFADSHIRIEVIDYSGLQTASSPLTQHHYRKVAGRDRRRCVSCPQASS